MANAPRDENRIVTLLGASNIDGSTPVIVYASPTSHRLYTDTSLSAVTSGGWSVARDIDLDEATPANIKATPGQVGGWFLYNNSASTIYIKLYNKATAPVLASDTPKLTIPIPAGSAANVEFTTGIVFDAGIGWAATTGVADNDVGALAANDCVANLLYI